MTLKHLFLVLPLALRRTCSKLLRSLSAAAAGKGNKNHKPTLCDTSADTSLLGLVQKGTDIISKRVALQLSLAASQ
jgi:hypothetical protein